jgi:transcriptional regulator NrdR family protein
MNARTRSKLDMGDRALNFSRAHPDASPGYAAALTGLEQRLTKAQELARAQQEGINQRRAANARKNFLRRQMSRAQLRHLARVAKVAAKDVPELAGKLVLKSQLRTYRSFRAVAGSMVAEAQTQKELLVKHGLADTVLDSLVQSLDQFDKAITDGTDALRTHVSARVELDVLGDEVVDLVQVMDTVNRTRFAANAATLAEWETVSNIIGPAHPAADKPAPATPPTGGEVRPAA